MKDMMTTIASVLVLMMFLLQTHFLQPCRLLTIEIILFFLQRNIRAIRA